MRLFSMANYFIFAFTKVLFSSHGSILFMVTTPPFLGLIGLLFKKIRGQKYVMLVYDILPEALVSAGLIKDGLIVKMWRRLNRAILNNAEAVITIGDYMADNLKRDFDVSKTTLGYIPIIHNWEDVELIKPLAKEQNPFIHEHGLEGKFIVMYSGNIGMTHDMETLIEAAKKLKDNQDIKFVIIGEGAKKQFIVDTKEKHGLENILIMSYLPQDQLPHSIPSADISIVSISKGLEGYLLPCKFYSYLAAGTAIIAICNDNGEIADIINNEQCGKVISVGDAAGLEATILNYYKNKDDLTQAKANSRNAAVQKYSRKNSQLYVDVIKKIETSH